MVYLPGIRTRAIPQTRTPAPGVCGNTFHGHDLQGRGKISQAPSPPYFPLGEGPGSPARTEAATDSALGQGGAWGWLLTLLPRPPAPQQPRGGCLNLIPGSAAGISQPRRAGS